LLARPSGAGYMMLLQDRWGDHGEVGVCLLDGGRVLLVAVSCRVLALEPALPFLVAALRAEAYTRPFPSST